MPLVIADRVKETTTTTGTGTITLAGAATGFRSFSVVGNGNTTYYAIVEPIGGAWEVGIGTYSTTGPTLARTTVLSSSNSGSLVNFPAGTKEVYVTYPAGRSVFSDGFNASGTWGINISGNAANVTGTVAIANGGTGATTRQEAMDALAGAVTAGQYLRGNGTDVVMSAIQAADVPTLNQNTTGTASNVTGTVAVANGGTGSTTAAGARTNLGSTTVGDGFFTLTNPGAIRFTRINADNTVSALDAATFRTAIGAGTGSGTVTSVGGTGSVNGITLSGTVTSSGSLTLGGSLSGVSLTTQVSGTLPVGNGGTGATTLTGVVIGNGASAFTVKTNPSGAFVGDTDTQTLTNKTLTSPDITQNVQLISTNTTAVRSRTYVLTASLTLTLPASPAAGDWVAFINRSGTTTASIARNGSNIMSLAEDMTLDSAQARGTLVFADATRGWTLID